MELQQCLQISCHSKVPAIETITSEEKKKPTQREMPWFKQWHSTPNKKVYAVNIIAMHDNKEQKWMKMFSYTKIDNIFTSTCETCNPPPTLCSRWQFSLFQVHLMTIDSGIVNIKMIKILVEQDSPGNSKNPLSHQT